MSVRVSWDISTEDIEGPDELSEFIIETLNLVNPQGTRGISLWVGPPGAVREDMPLRLDLDPEPGSPPVASIEMIAELPEITHATVTGAASVRWIPNGLVADDPAFPRRDIAVMEDSGQALSTVPADLVRVSIPTAIRLAAAYARTGERPEGIAWQALPSGDANQASR